MHVIRLKQLIQFDLTGFCKTLVAIVWNMDSCNIVTKTVSDCVKAIAACLTSCIFASFGCWASLGKLGQGDSAGVAEVFPSWEQMGARLICVSTIRSPLGPPGTCGPTNTNTNANTNTKTQLQMGMGAFSCVATGHSHKEELTDKYRAWENWFLDTTRRLFKEIVFHSMTQKLIEGLKSISLHLWIFSIQWSLP